MAALSILRTPARPRPVLSPVPSTPCAAGALPPRRPTFEDLTLAERAALDPYAARTVVMARAQLGDVLMYCDRDQRRQAGAGIVTGRLTNPAGDPVLVVDDRVAIGVWEVLAPRGAWYVLPGDAVEVQTPAGWLPAIVERVEGNRQSPGIHVEAGGDARLDGVWACWQVRVRP